MAACLDLIKHIVRHQISEAVFISLAFTRTIAYSLVLVLEGKRLLPEENRLSKNEEMRTILRV